MKKVNYYKLTYSTDRKEVGHINQVEDLSIKVDAQVIKTYQGKVVKIWTDEVPDYSVFRLYYNAKVTDLLSAGKYVNMGQAWLISNKMKEILERYTSDNFRFYDALVTDTYNHKLHYNVCGVNLSPNIIDYPASEFMISNILCEENIGPIAISSFEDLRNKQDPANNIYIKLNKVVLMETRDIIRLPLYSRILVSERLKTDLIEAKITGIDIEDVKKFEFYLK